MYLNGNHIEAQWHIAYIFQKFILTPSDFHPRTSAGTGGRRVADFWAGRAPPRRMVALPRGARPTDVAFATWGASWAVRQRLLGSPDLTGRAGGRGMCCVRKAVKVSTLMLLYIFELFWKGASI